MLALAGVSGWFGKNFLQKGYEEWKNEFNQVIITPKKLSLSDKIPAPHSFIFSIYNDSPEMKSNVWVKIFSKNVKFDNKEILIKNMNNKNMYLLPSCFYQGIYPGGEFNYLKEQKRLVDEPDYSIIRFDALSPKGEHLLYLLIRNIGPKENLKYTLLFFDSSKIVSSLENDIYLKVISYESGETSSHYNFSSDGEGTYQFNATIPENFKPTDPFQIQRPIIDQNVFYWLSKFVNINKQEGTITFELEGDGWIDNPDLVDIVPFIANRDFEIHVFKDTDHSLKAIINNSSHGAITLIFENVQKLKSTKSHPSHNIKIGWWSDGYILSIDGDIVDRFPPHQITQ